MNSFISHFKPWVLALVCLTVFEAGFQLAFNPPRITWNSFLDFKFTEQETFQRLVAHDKVIASEGFHADIIQVGDSSGLHGVIPPVVMSYLPGYTYVNMSVATNLGFSGYLNLARLQLKRNPSARYLVLYASPIGGVPRKILWDDDQNLMAPQIYNEFLSPLHHLFQLPSLSFRQEVIGNAYYLGYRFQQKDAVLSKNRGYLAFTKSFRETNGWVRETDVEGDIPSDIFKNILAGANLNDSENVRAALRKLPKVTDEYFFDWHTFQRRSYFDVVYGAFANLANAHGVKLILVFNPLPESLRRPEFEELMDWKAIEASLARFRKQHPEVIVTNFEFWPDEDFSVFSHIATPASIKSSRRVGELLAKVIEPRSIALFGSERYLFEPQNSLDIDLSGYFAGYGWTDSAGATAGFPMQHIGPRGKAWIFAHIKPGSGYLLKIFYKGIREDVRGMRLFVNGTNAIRKTGGDG
ncbi:hypothetical protein [Polynucleobacter paneuropaeus]|uniref:hypothetical protein n=1 Tax=Polynucleobacter paneuropaeus TaxID=2527775 RepID=UPI001BFD06EE|nr:hypothetical protein [Polynucleobacter paneuropaeus]MBT8621907.1 hypothetical protein [Polynucleobacter paneuropaeus]